MPSMANITVKNAAGTDVVYVAKVPSAGDRSPARWSFDASSPVIGFRPVFEMTTRSNGQANGRIAEFNYMLPIVQTVAGVQQLVAKVPFKGAFTMPTNVDATLASDGFVQLGNLLVSALIRDAATTGYAPT